MVLSAKSEVPAWRDVHTIVFDFDGVFTDNNVYLNADGQEFVQCSRSDGLAIDLLRCFSSENNWQLDFYILTKERSPIAQARAAKMKSEAIIGVDCKSEYIANRLSLNRQTTGLPAWAGVVYLGNDVNDYMAMKLSGYSICPCDAHPIIKCLADLVMPQKGGAGFVRASIEALINFDSHNHSFFTLNT